LNFQIFEIELDVSLFVGYNGFKGEFLPYKWKILNMKGAYAPLFFTTRMEKNGRI